MKKAIISILSTLTLSVSGCNYLDINPEMGLDEDQVFTVWDNFKSYYYNIYTTPTGIHCAYPLYLDMNARRYTWYQFTDLSDAGRLLRCQQIKSGTMGENAAEFTTSTAGRAISYSMFRIIRVCNKCIENIGRVQNVKQENKDDLLGQAYFVRAYAHFTLCRIFGGMPYLDKALDENDEWDMARLTAWETYSRCAEDFDRAYECFVSAGKVRRDAAPGTEGHLTSSDMAYPNGVAAKAMKARALLYAASKLNNLHGQSDWEDAAEACGEAIRIAEEYGYDLVPGSEWSSNFWGAAYTNEHIWAWNYGSGSYYQTDVWSAVFAYPQANFSKYSGECPTQNCVDLFDTVWGDPLETEAERQEAIAQGHYDEQDPYSNRDPRLDLTVVHDGSVVSMCPTGINIHYDPSTGTYPMTVINSQSRQFGIAWGSMDSKSTGYSNTGYYINKWWNGGYGSGTASRTEHTDPLIRMAELYLNYAEAVNEVSGPQGTAGGLSLTALEAVNKVRNRIGMPDVLDKFTGSASLLRERIRNERCVELAFEGHHYYHDIRRWMIAPQKMTATLTGMYIEKTDVSEQYPKGRIYTRRAIPQNRQSSWKDAMYYIPFPTEEANKMKNFVNNEIW